MNKYVVAVSLLVVLAVAFGIFGTVAPPLAEESTPVQPQQELSESVGHFQNPPTYDSGWVSILDKRGKYFDVSHNLGTTEIVVDIVGKQSLEGVGGEHQINLGEVGNIHGWSRVYNVGGHNNELDLIQTIDGGYALTGSVPNRKMYLIKTGPTGNVQWNKTYGDLTSGASSLIQTSDGGFVLAGYIDLPGRGADWLVRTDSCGNMLWDHTYIEPPLGGWAFWVIQTSDGGFAVAGTRNVEMGDQDFWLAKIDCSGNMMWNCTYGNAECDRAECVVQTSDGGYALLGTTEDFVANNIDIWLIKTDSTGNAQWDKTYGDSYGYDFAHSVVQTFDGGYALASSLYSESADANCFGLIKTDATGNMQWSRIDESIWGEAYSVIQTSDEGYALAGFIHVTGAVNDFALVKTDADGNMQWYNTYGGANTDIGKCGIQISDGGYALAGATRSFPSGEDRVWLVKTGLESGLAWTNSTTNEITLYRGELDPYWNYVRVRIWIIKEPSWIYGDINMDGVVDAKDLYIIGRNYGKTFSLLSLSGIITVAGIRTVKKRKQSKQPNYNS